MTGPERNPARGGLQPGLHFIATPIGNARDISLRALDMLAGADVLAAEDTRSLRRLMEIHGIALAGRPLLAYHDHNGAKVRPRLLEALAAGKSVLYASEAGTPLLADPGFDLGRAAAGAGYPVTAAPGASALLAALTVSGLPTDRFFFAGFLPNARAARRRALGELAAVPGTLVFYESPRRVAAMLKDAESVLGGGRQAALCRELTKKFEECRRGTLADLTREIDGTTPKGEIVVLIGAADSPIVDEFGLDRDLEEALRDMSVRDAAEMVAVSHGLPKRKVYQMALKMGRDE